MVQHKRSRWVLLPAGATVAVNGDKYVTPTILDLPRNQDQTLLFSKDGYQDSSAALSSSLNGWLIGDILIWGPFAFLDFTNGSAYKLSDESVTMTMVANPPPVPVALSKPILEATPGPSR